MTRHRAPRSASASSEGGRRGPRRVFSGDFKVSALRLLLQVAQRARVKMAIGGGVAVSAQGYRRETQDVDAFFHYADRRRVLRALSELAGSGLELTELDESHWVAVPEDAVEDERIDLMFASGDPEESAVEMAQRKSFRGVRVPVFTVEWLVVSKFLAEREDPKDWLDIYALYKRGAFDVKDVVRRLRQMGLREDARKFPEMLERIENLKKGI